MKPAQLCEQGNSGTLPSERHRTASLGPLGDRGRPGWFHHGPGPQTEKPHPVGSGLCPL